MMPFFARRVLVVMFGALLAATPVARAQIVSQWTGAATPNNNWTTAGNWDMGEPGTGDSALFSGAGGGNTTINLGGTTQTIKEVLFDTASAAAYTIGQSAGDALSFDNLGLLQVDDSVTTAQTINATVLNNGLLEVKNSVNNGVSGAPGEGLAGLTLGPINMTGGNLIINNGPGLATNLNNTTTKLNGTISDTVGQPGTLILRASVGGTANNTNFIINGNNTYIGGTTIEANTGTNGAIYVGTDSAFGTGKITTQSSANNGEIRALGGTRTIANAIDLNQGLSFAGTNSIVLSGPIAVASAANRLLTSKIPGPAALSFGATPGSSTIYLGNPVSIGGDGSARGILLSANTGANLVLNAQIVDVDATNTSSVVQYGGNLTGNVLINHPQTYTSKTRFGGGSSNVLFKHDYVAGGTSGPFGLGTLIANSTTNSQIAPIEGDRTIANPFRLDFGFTVVNITGDTSGVNFSGPITFVGCFTAGGTSGEGVTCGGTSATERLVQNLMPASGGTLTLGSAASPSTLTLAADQPDKTLRISGSGKTIINDTIQDGNANITHIAVSNSSTTTFNGLQSTNGNFSVTGANSTVIINGNRTGTGTTTLNGANAKLFFNGSKTGSGAVTVTAGTLGGTGSIAGAVTNNGTIAPGTSVGTLTMTGNVTMGANSHLAIELSGATADKLGVGGLLDLSAVEFLDITGTGTGSSWVIADYGTLTGTFENVTAGYTVNYGSLTNSSITLTRALVPGDYNGNGVVDGADYVVWRKNKGLTGTPTVAQGNGNGDSVVDDADYDYWRARFGNTSGNGSGLGAAAAVPEPATLLLVCFAIAALPAASARRAAR